MNQYLKLLVTTVGAATIGIASLPSFATLPPQYITVVPKPTPSAPKPMTLPPSTDRQNCPGGASPTLAV